MSRIASSSVEVFPSVRRGVNASYKGSRVTTEQSFVRLINTLINTDGFIINKRGDLLEFNLYGYYFKVSVEAIAELDLGDEVYAEIDLVVSGDNTELFGQDTSSGVYEGIDFTSSPSPTTSTHKSLHILTKVEDTYQPAAEGFIRFDSDSIEASYEVDGGVI